MSAGNRFSGRPLRFSLTALSEILDPPSGSMSGGTGLGKSCRFQGGVRKCQKKKKKTGTGCTSLPGIQPPLYPCKSSPFYWNVLVRGHYFPAKVFSPCLHRLKLQIYTQMYCSHVFEQVFFKRVTFTFGSLCFLTPLSRACGYPTFPTHLLVIHPPGTQTARLPSPPASLSQLLCFLSLILCF